MATKKSDGRPVVKFGRSGGYRADGVRACVWRSTYDGVWVWEVTIGGMFRSNKAISRELAEQAARRAIPGVARLALRAIDRTVEEGKKEVAACIARRKEMNKALAKWVQ